MSQGASPAGPGGPVVSVANIRGLGRNDPGLFKMSGEVFGWKNRRNGKVYQYKSSDIADAQWIHCGADQYQLKVVLGPHRNDSIVRFDGFHKKVGFRFHPANYVLLSSKVHPLSRTTMEPLEGNNLNVSVDGCPAFEVNAQDIVQVTTPSKNDLAIELVQDDTRDQAEDLLLEIRLFQPATGDEETDSHLQNLKEILVKKSGVAETKMESIALLNDVPLLVPRGRYEIDVGRRALKFHGKSYDYTILYTNINRNAREEVVHIKSFRRVCGLQMHRMFLVPRPNSPHVNFIVSLDNAMRQGQTSYPFVVMQFDSETVTSVEVNLEEAELKEKGLEKQIEGDFKSVKSQYGITCSYRAQSGHLYPLNRSFLFIVKPVIFVRRTGASTTNRFFAFTVSCRGGVEHEFTSIDRNEYTEAEIPTDEDDDDYGGEESETDEDFEEDEGEDESEASASEANDDEGDKDKKRKKKHKVS
ncbi:hypothetical protein ACSSS7_001607 [Eimeria intestinalis]